MGSIHHAIQWCKGEIYEGKIILLFGILFLISTICLWKFGTTPNAKASIIPLLVVALLHISTGMSIIYSNSNRLNEFTMAFNANKDDFRQSEINRTENFIKWYPNLRYLSLGLIVVGFILVAFVTAPTWRSIGLCIMLSAFSIIVIDYFSEERAIQYHENLVAEN